jgi:hypothetical protein
LRVIRGRTERVGVNGHRRIGTILVDAYVAKIRSFVRGPWLHGGRTRPRRVTSSRICKTKTRR